MKLIITLTEAEKQGIISYLMVDEINDQSTEKGIDFAIELEVQNRLYHALRDPKAAISGHIIEAENKVLKSLVDSCNPKQ